jgi:hypothetical protein
MATQRMTPLRHERRPIQPVSLRAQVCAVRGDALSGSNISASSSSVTLSTGAYLGNITAPENIQRGRENRRIECGQERMWVDLSQGSWKSDQLLVRFWPDSSTGACAPGWSVPHDRLDNGLETPRIALQRFRRTRKQKWTHKSKDFRHQFGWQGSMEPRHVCTKRSSD